MVDTEILDESALGLEDLGDELCPDGLVLNDLGLIEGWSEPAVLGGVDDSDSQEEDCAACIEKSHLYKKVIIFI